MLSVSVQLHCRFVAVFQGIAIAGLYRTADPQVHGQIQIRDPGLPQQLPGIIQRAVVHHQKIVRRDVLHEIAHHPVLEHSRVAVKHHHAVFAALLRGMLR